MKFARNLNKKLIFLHVNFHAKEEAIKFLAEELCRYHKIPYEKDIITSVIEREKISSTGLDGGLAVPHGRIEVVDKLYVVFGRSTRGIDWGSCDGKLVHYMFLVVGPNKLAKEYLEMLGQISRVMLRHDVKEAIRHATESEEVIEIIKTSGIRHHKR